VRIGAIPALALSLLPPAVLEWKRDYPDMACELSSDHSRELVQKLLMREIDLALTLNFSGHPGLTTQVLANGVLVALASKGYWSDAESSKPLPLVELAGAPLIGLSSADPLAAKLDSYLENVDPPPRVTISVQTYSLARAMVESGAGLTVIDPFTALGASTATTCIRPLTPPLPITLYALTRADEPPPHMLANLLEIFGNRARELLERL
jgi:DNA-binding transcriptional LysR family regulator